jgi:hypothetical protein
VLATLCKVPGAVPRSRSTWNQHVGTATVSVYGPPAAKTPVLVAKSVWGKERVADGIV